MLFGLTAASALVLSIATSAAPVPTLSRAGGDTYVPGQVIVRYAAGTTRTDRHAAADDAGATEVESLGTARTELLQLDAGVSVDEAIAELELNPDVAYAEPNYLYEISATPNDTNFGQLWGLNQASDKDIDAPEAWDLTTGSSSIIVAVIDSGVAYDHPDLAPNIWTNDDDRPATATTTATASSTTRTAGDFFQGDIVPLDANGHGTHVAGTIGARGNNALGVTGVNWEVSIMPLRAGDAERKPHRTRDHQLDLLRLRERRPRGERQLRRQRVLPADVRRDQLAGLREHAVRLRRRERRLRRRRRQQRLRSRSTPATTTRRGSSASRPRTRTTR